MISREQRETIETLVIRIASTRSELTKLLAELDAAWAAVPVDEAKVQVVTAPDSTKKERRSRVKTEGRLSPALEKLSALLESYGETGVSLDELEVRLKRPRDSIRSDLSRLKKHSRSRSIGVGAYQHTKFQKELVLTPG